MRHFLTQVKIIQNHFVLVINNNNELEIVSDDVLNYTNPSGNFGNYSTGIDMSNDEWTYISVVFSSVSGILKVYVNAILQDQYVFENTNSISSTGYLVFGVDQDSYGGGFSEPYSGYIDNIEIWNSNLTQLEIEENMNCLLITDEINLYGYWNFDDLDLMNYNSLNGNPGYDYETYAIDLTGNNNGYIWDASPNSDFPNLNCSNCENSDEITVTFNVCGCMDETACNYNETATEDDESCEYISPIDLGEDISSCDESVVLDAGEGYQTYLWSTGENTQTIEVSDSGTYSVDVANNQSNNYSMYFDGVNDYISIGIPSEMNPSESHTFMFLGKKFCSRL